MSLSIATLGLALQVTVSVGTQGAGVRTGEEEERRPVRRAPVTEALRRSAFKDDAARTLLLRARAARLTQDSLLVSYDAKSYQRLSVGMSLRETARERLAFRTENAARVRWHRDAGARVDVLGSRSAVPFSGEMQKEVNSETSDMVGIPYYPGKEQLWSGGGLAKAEVDERELVHPIAEGSEAYYIFATGDSVLMTLPDGRKLTLRELRITAREPKWNVTVGSFWFDVESAHLVRAVYRLSTPMDIWAVAKSEDSTAMDDVPLLVRPLLNPMRADITAISVEYGLYNQRFWLPKLQGMEGYARASFLRIPIRMEERYRYESVNGLDSLPKLPPAPPTARMVRDSLRASGLDSAAVRKQMAEYHARRDTVARLRRTTECATGESYTEIRRRYDGSLPLTLVYPCDSTKLTNSPELPGSIYDVGEELFGVKERDELLKTLDLGLQSAWAPQPPVFEWGLAHTRYNRVEGFSTGGLLRSTLGKGYTAGLGARASWADQQINGDLTLSRSNGRSELRGRVYRRLDVMNDWGSPLSFGSSLSSLLYARDEGFYHRSWGAELGGTRPSFGVLDWRLFAEQQWAAAVESRFSVFGGAKDDRFLANPAAEDLTLYGVGFRWRGSRGLDPRAWRLVSDVRGEAAAGHRDYVRGLVDLTVSRGLGPIAASLTASAGSTGGTVPVQRRFYLGGLQTIRGQTAGTGVGDAFWMSRVEVGGGNALVRPIVFGDIGWAGSRTSWQEIGRPMSGAGVGASFLDGMIRVDLARGISPRAQTRLDLYLEARF